VEPLKQHGVDLNVKSLYPEWLYNLRKRGGRKWWLDAVTLIIAFSRQISYSIVALNADIILILKNAAPFSLTPLLKFFRRMGKRVVFDFDDAIYLKTSIVEKYVRLADIVIAGNKMLAEWAREKGAKPRVIPTVIDLNKYLPRVSYELTANRLRIGWIGSPSTEPFLKIIKPVLLKLNVTYPIEFCVIGGKPPDMAEVPLKVIEWSEETEAEEISKFDIGVAPLLDNEYTRGKCGLKVLQYMAAGIPVVASPVGVHLDIIEHGNNGFLAGTDSEWLKYLTLLAGDSELRKNIGQQGRKTVEEKFSLNHMAEQVSVLFKSLHSNLSM
jgi:glycosyltransferase involved in cell wall biosynthesis